MLQTVVEVYIGDGAPVSSQRILEVGASSYSSATIRNRMASLERDGYLSKPHTSSGRVPTDEGYRLYVNGLLTESHLDRIDGAELAARCRSNLRGEARDIGEIMSKASHLLGSLTHNFAVVYGAVEQESRVSHVKLVSLDDRRVMVIATLDPAYERTTILRFSRDMAPAAVASSEILINRLVADTSLVNARERLENVVRDNVTDEGILTSEVSSKRQEIFSEPPAVELYFEEHNHLLEQPELSDPKILQLVLKLLHNKPYLQSILSSRSQEGTEVTIGGENDDAALQNFSLVTAGYRMGAARGVLGIIGPTRMRYDLALSLVGLMSRELRAIGEEFF